MARDPAKALERSRRYNEKHRDEVNRKSLERYYADHETNKTRLRERAKVYRAANRDRVNELARLQRIEKKYGLTPEQYAQMLFEQGGKCKICNELPDTGSKLVVDHDHMTGNVRALLCSQCNSGLGMFQDSSETLYSAVYYLQEHAGGDYSI